MDAIIPPHPAPTPGNTDVRGKNAQKRAVPMGSAIQKMRVFRSTAPTTKTHFFRWPPWFIGKYLSLSIRTQLYAWNIFQTSIVIRCIDAYSINTASNRYQWFSFTGTSSNADDYSYGSVSNVGWCSKFGSYTEAAMRNPSHHAVKIPLIMGKSLNWCSQAAHHGCLIAVVAVVAVVALGRRPGDHVSLFWNDRNWMLTNQFMAIKWE